MEQVTSLAVRQPTPNVWAMITQVAASAKAAGKFGLVKQQEAEIKMLTAWENGFPLTSSFQIVHVIEGVPALSPKAVWAKVQLSPEFGGYTEERLTDDNGGFKGYRINLKRKNGVTATRQFTLEDAKRAGLDRKTNWLSYAENMCYWRAMGFVEDVVFPDVTLGMVRADDLGALVNASGDVIDTEWTVMPTQVEGGPQAGSELPVEDAGALLQSLVETFGAQRVMDAAGGAIPASLEQVQAAAIRLAEGQA